MTIINFFIRTGTVLKLLLFKSFNFLPIVTEITSQKMNAKLLWSYTPQNCGAIRTKTYLIKEKITMQNKLFIVHVPKLSSPNFFYC